LFHVCFSCHEKQKWQEEECDMYTLRIKDNAMQYNPIIQNIIIKPLYNHYNPQATD